MKKLITAAALIAMCSTLHAAYIEPEEADTVKIIEHVDKVTVTREGNTTTLETISEKSGNTDLFTYSVTVDDSENDTWDLELPFYNSGKGKKNGERGIQKSFIVGEQFYFGRRFNYSGKGNIKKSCEVGVRNLGAIKWSLGDYLPSFSIGLGWSAQFYLTQDGYVFGKEGSNLIVKPVGEGQKKKESLLSVFSIQVPLMFSQMITKDIKFNLGGVGYFNTYATATSSYTVGDIKHTTTYKGLQQRLFTADLVCGIGFNQFVGIYASWSPMTLFQSPYGPQLKSWSIGASLLF